MINTAKEVITGISKKLNTLNYPVFVDEVKSNLPRGCFIILVVNYEHKKLPSKRYLNSIPMQVIYIPENIEKTNFELLEISSKLHYLLDVITLSDNIKIRGLKMESQILNDTLYFNVDYQIILNKLDDTSKMDKLTINNGVITN